MTLPEWRKQAEAEIAAGAAEVLMPPEIHNELVYRQKDLGRDLTIYPAQWFFRRVPVRCVQPSCDRD